MRAIFMKFRMMSIVLSRSGSTWKYDTLTGVDEKISKDKYKEIIGFSYYLIKKIN